MCVCVCVCLCIGSLYQAALQVYEMSIKCVCLPSCLDGCVIWCQQPVKMCHLLSGGLLIYKGLLLRMDVSCVIFYQDIAFVTSVCACVLLAGQQVAFI